MWWPEPRGGSLQRRLTAGLLLGLGVLFAVLFAALAAGVDRALNVRLDAYLLRRSDTVAALLRIEDGAGHATERAALMPEFGANGHEDFYAVWDADGHVLQRSLSVGRGRLAAPPQWPLATPLFYDLVLPDGHRGRAVAKKALVGAAGRLQPVTIVVAQEREDVDRFRRSLRYGMLAATALGLLLAALLAALMVRWAFAPVHRLGAQSKALDPEQPAPRLDDGRLPRELRPLAASIDQAFARLYAAIGRERRFARDVAHELRTPLAELRTRAELALSAGDAAAVRTALESALEAGGRLQQSVDGLLALARYESGQERPQEEPVDLLALLAQPRARLEDEARMRGIRLAPMPAGECWVQSDPVLLARILDNLLGNAVAHASPDGEIAVGVEREATGVRLTIRNTARDLAADDLAHFGERFWRRRATPGSAHAGLGLALSRSIAAVLRLDLEFRLVDGMLEARLGPLRSL
ncbi:MAG: ATP-binding protein [Candidatus Levyibacteriota bacterium]